MKLINRGCDSADRRDWKRYEAKPKRCSVRRIVKYSGNQQKPSLKRNLKSMKRGKQGCMVEAPESLIGFSVFF